MLAAGRPFHLSPRKASTTATICWNFKWEEATDGLSVRVWPREWADSLKRFAPGSRNEDENGCLFELACPNFELRPGRKLEGRRDGFEGASRTVQVHVLNEPGAEVRGEPMVESYSLMLLRFFRDISSSRRLSILATLGALPPDLQGVVNETMERRAFDKLVKAGRSEDLWSELCKAIDEESGTG